MQTCTLGSCGVQVPPIGLGTVKLGRLAGLKYPASQQPHALPDDAQVLGLLREAAKLGVSLIDTAPAYGVSEQRLGELLYRIQPRQRWILCTKVGEEFSVDRTTGKGSSSYDFSAQAITASVHRSLARLKTDYLDIVLLHFSSATDDEAILNSGIAYDTLETLRDAGKIKAVGASTASLAGGLIAAQRCQVAMLTLSPAEHRDAAAISEAGANKCGVMIKKALDSGNIVPDRPRPVAEAPQKNHAKASSASAQAAAQPEKPMDPVQAALRLVLAHEPVHTVIVGTTNPKHLDAAVLIAESVRGE